LHVHGVNGDLLVEQGACEMWGELEKRAGRVSTGRVGPGIEMSWPSGQGIGLAVV
jgi:hypothetical protein